MKEDDDSSRGKAVAHRDDAVRPYLDGLLERGHGDGTTRTEASAFRAVTVPPRDDRMGVPNVDRVSRRVLVAAGAR
jgi:hypothetical protein